MYILPYYIEQKGELKILWLYLTGFGTKLWETDKEDGKKVSLDFVKKEYLEANGFRGKCRVKKDIVLCEMSMVNVQEFYLYTDPKVQEVLDVWRSFFMIKGAGWEEEAKKVNLGSFGTLEQIWNLILE